MKHVIMAVVATTLMLANSPAFADTFKVGYMTTLSGSAGIIGKQMQNGVNLAHLSIPGVNLAATTRK